MQKNFNVTGEQRKQMVQAISQAVGVEPVYMRMPTCAYVISNITVSKTGEIIWDERTDEKVIARVMEALTAAGFTEAAPETETEPETGTGPEEAGADPEPDAGNESDKLVIEMPKEGFTDEAIENLRKIIGSKASLLKKSIGADDLTIEVTEERIRFPWFPIPEDGTEAAAYTHLVSAVCELAKNAKRVNGTDHPVESEKYAFRTWLLRLGFIGAESKKERAILMRNLSGHAAFRNRADAEAFYEKVKAKKAEKRAGTEDNSEVGTAPVTMDPEAGGISETAASES